MGGDDDQHSLSGVLVTPPGPGAWSACAEHEDLDVAVPVGREHRPDAPEHVERPVHVGTVERPADHRVPPVAQHDHAVGGEARGDPLDQPVEVSTG